ncbi:transcription factor, partial [Selaginella moellendorffii]
MSGADDGSVPLDVAQAEGQVWLLKLPAIVATAWNAQDSSGKSVAAGAGPADPTLAKVTCTFDPLNPDPEAALEFTMELSGPDDIKAYSLNLQKDVVPTHIFSDTQGRLAVEGKVERKFDIKPNSKAREEYRQLCRERDRKFNMKTRTIQVLKDDRGNLMRPALPPTIMLQSSKDAAKRKAPVNAKNNDGKRTRRERGELEDHVFKLFEQQANWALKQLVQRTDQPVAFLKEILNDLCTYNKRGTNQGTYELKPEYRKNPVEE